MRLMILLSLCQQVMGAETRSKLAPPLLRQLWARLHLHLQLPLMVYKVSYIDINVSDIHCIYISGLWVFRNLLHTLIQSLYKYLVHFLCYKLKRRHFQYNYQTQVIIYCCNSQ